MAGLHYKSLASGGGSRVQLEIFDSGSSHYFYMGGAYETVI